MEGVNYLFTFLAKQICKSGSFTHVQGRERYVKEIVYICSHALFILFCLNIHWRIVYNYIVNVQA